MSRAAQAVQLLVQDPTLEGAKKALAELGLRFPGRSFYYPHAQKGQVKLPEGPVVLKVSDPFIPHKTECGAVLVCEQLTQEILDKFVENVERNLAQEATKHAQAADSDGPSQLVAEATPQVGPQVREVTLEEKICIPEGGETLLSMLNDPAFGPVMVFGEGGRLTELRRSVKRWLPSTPPQQIANLLESLPLAKLWFKSFRGLPAQANLEKLSLILADLGEVVEEFHRLRPDLQIVDFEINPLAFTCGQEPLVLDLLFNVKKIEKTAPLITRPNLERLAQSLHSAKAVAVAGCSTSDLTNLGRVVYERLRKSFPGQTWAINPKGGDIDGQTVYKSVSDLPFAPDVLVMALSARFTTSTLREAHKRFGSSLGTVLILASGFDETSGGKEAGRELREATASLGDIPVLGPNTMALYSQTGSAGDVKIDFLPEGRVTMSSFPDPSQNNTALILQSGARFSSFLDCLPGLGFRWSIMVGNAYQTDVADGLALAAQDPGTRVAAAYLEGLQPLAGRRLAQAVEACRKQGKLVVIQKGGQTKRGAAAAQSHTASMSGSNDIFRDIITQAGALIVESETEFRDVVKLASLYDKKRPQGRNVFVMNGAGYEGVLTSDELARRGLELPKPPLAVTEVLRPYLGTILDSTNNPADVGPVTHDSAYGPAIRAALDSGLYHSALLAIMPYGNGMEGVFPPFEAKPELLGPTIVQLNENYSQPVAVAVNGSYRYEPFRRYLEDHAIPVFPDAERAAHALGLWTNLCLGCQEQTH